MTEPKPLDYWRNRLDDEIMLCIYHGQLNNGLARGKPLSDLAYERLQELLICGHTGKSEIMEKIKAVEVERLKQQNEGA